MSQSVLITGSPAHSQNSDAVSLHAAACNSLQRALSELRRDHTDYTKASAQVCAALNAVRTLGLIAEIQKGAV